MPTNGPVEDVAAIEALIRRQFASISWTPASPADWDAFTADFLPDASLFPSARPAKRQSLGAFVERMKGLRGTTLENFQQDGLGTAIRIFGNVAVAVAACEVTENEATVTRSVEMMLLVKEDGRWRIVSQAWDRASPTRPIPPDLRWRSSGPL